MIWSSTVSTALDTDDAVAELIDETWRKLDGAPDFVAVFCSRHHRHAASAIPRTLRDAFDTASIVGCTGYSVIGGGREEERESAVALVAARLPDTRLIATAVPGTADLTALDEVNPDDVAALLIIADSFSTDSDKFLRALDKRFPEATKFGGLASGGVYAGGNALFAGDRALHDGAVVLAFCGDVQVDTIVSQGCRPIGEPMRVVEHRDNIIFKLDDPNGSGRPQDVLGALYETMTPREREEAPSKLHIGLAVPDSRAEYLIRPLMGFDPNTGAVSVSEQIRDDVVVQFHLRDAASCTADLHARIAGYRSGRDHVEGALLFSCIGRGERLFGTPNHDTDMFADAYPNTPIGGFFCGGEIGAIGKRTFMHGYTSSFALFRTPSK